MSIHVFNECNKIQRNASVNCNPTSIVKFVPYLFPSALLFLTACFFEYHPYEMRLEPSMRDLNAKAYQKIQQTPPTDTLRIALIADTQRSYDAVERIVNSANSLSYDFMLVAGDITEYGLEQEYRWVHNILKKLHRPYVATIGNHDYQGDGSHIFQKMYGPVNDWFRYGHFNFVVHDTNSREHNFSGSTPNVPWLSSALANENYTNIVLGHVPPFSDDFDADQKVNYEHMLTNRNVLLAIYGHTHAFHTEQPDGHSFAYIVCPSPDKNFYLMVSVWADGYELEKIYY